MPLAAGDKLGPYEILAPIGKGGMGEVYRAHDPRTGRDVAIKVSAERFSERFDREVRAVAALNHPNICTLFDVGPDYLVMEFIEGEALDSLIKTGPLPLEEALRIARQIAAALEEAHDKGVVHRDLKPGNIKIKPDGAVKVLDFGLAKISPAEAGATPSENSPTLSMAATQAGVILGTAAYMAPEQAKGRPVDKRADIWAFGVVLHEMLTGERLFQQDDVMETLAAVVMKAPELGSIPVEVRRLLKKCLEKDPKKRLRDIGDLWELLDEPPAPPAPPVEIASEVPMVQPPPRRAAWLPWTLAGVLFVALAGLAAWHFRPAGPLAITKFPILLGEGQALDITNRGLLAISPDGTQMVYGSNRRFYLRSMQELEARAIPGTELGDANVLMPVFSPDGRSLAFYAVGDRTIKKIAISGGAAVTICQLNGAPIGMSWGPDGIVFPVQREIMRVSANGGTPERLLSVEDGERPGVPQVLPGGQAVLFTLAPGDATSAQWDKAKVVVQTLKPGPRKVLIEVGSDGRYLPTGHLVYSAGGVLYAVPFDLGKLAVTGGPVPIVEGVMRTNAFAQFSFSSTGSLIYVPGPVTGTGKSQNSLAVIDRKGEVQPLNLDPRPYAVPRVSHNGKRVAYETDDGKEAAVWTYDLSGEHAPNRLTLTGANRYPIWSADGEWVAFQSNREGDLSIWRQRADGTGAAERLTKPEKGAAHGPDSWSPDNQRFLFTEVKNNVAALWTYSLQDKKPTIYAEAAGSYLAMSVFSPDGHWVAYQAGDQRGTQIHVKPFPPDATDYLLSKDGNGNHTPLWSPDGKQLFWIPAQTKLVGVSVTTKPSFTFSSPVQVPRGGFFDGGTNVVRNYDILPDGRFIGVVPAGQTQAGPAAAQILVVLNWFEDVKQRVTGR